MNKSTESRPPRNYEQRRPRTSEDKSPRDPSRSPKRELIREVIAIRRVSKTTSRGRIRGISIIAVSGDGRGRVGCAVAGSKEIQTASAKAARLAEIGIKQYPMWDRRTIPHDSQASFGPVTVLIRKAPRGTGIIAGGVIRTIFEAMGVKDVVAKVICGKNPLNVVQALIKALELLRSPSRIEIERGIKKVA